MTEPEQPDALRLADCCDTQSKAWLENSLPYIERKQTAAELRRQHARIVELLAQQVALEHEIEILKASGKRRAKG